MSNSDIINKLEILWTEINNNDIKQNKEIKFRQAHNYLINFMPKNNWTISKMEPLINPINDLEQNRIPNKEEWDKAIQTIKNN